MTLLLVALLSAGGVAVPLLDTAPADHRPQVEASHDPSRCEVGHDHLACRLLSGGATTPSEPPGVELGADRASVGPVLRTSDAPTTPSRTLPEPRGPPAAG